MSGLASYSASFMPSAVPSSVPNSAPAPFQAPVSSLAAYGAATPQPPLQPAVTAPGVSMGYTPVESRLNLPTGLQGVLPFQDLGTADLQTSMMGYMPTTLGYMSSPGVPSPMSPQAPVPQPMATPYAGAVPPPQSPAGLAKSTAILAEIASIGVPAGSMFGPTGNLLSPDVRQETLLATQQNLELKQGLLNEFKRWQNAAPAPLLAIQNTPTHIPVPSAGLSDSGLSAYGATYGAFPNPAVQGLGPVGPFGLSPQGGASLDSPFAITPPSGPPSQRPGTRTQLGPDPFGRGSTGLAGYAGIRGISPDWKFDSANSEFRNELTGQVRSMIFGRNATTVQQTPGPAISPGTTMAAAPPTTSNQHPPPMAQHPPNVPVHAQPGSSPPRIPTTALPQTAAPSAGSGRHWPRVRGDRAFDLIVRAFGNLAIFSPKSR